MIISHDISETEEGRGGGEGGNGQAPKPPQRRQNPFNRTQVKKLYGYICVFFSFNFCCYFVFFIFFHLVSFAKNQNACMRKYYSKNCHYGEEFKCFNYCIHYIIFCIIMIFFHFKEACGGKPVIQVILVGERVNSCVIDSKFCKLL